MISRTYRIIYIILEFLIVCDMSKLSSLRLYVLRGFRIEYQGCLIVVDSFPYELLIISFTQQK